MLKVGQELGHQRRGMKSLSRGHGRIPCQDWLRQVEDRAQIGSLAEKRAQRSLSRKVFAKDWLDFIPNSPQQQVSP